jgi:hypothetical protein
MRRYPEDVHQFIVKNYFGITTKALIGLINREFGTAYTVGQIRSYKKNHGLKSGSFCGVPAGLPTKAYPDEIREFIRNNYVGVGHQGMADLLNQKFGTSYTREQMKAVYARWKLNSGRTGRFPKGYVSGNPIPKGTHLSPETEFRKGHRPRNQRPVGDEVLRTDGYVWVKIAELNKWRQKHVLIWESENGPRPKKHVIIFGDGNRCNFNPDNLILVSQAQLVRLNQKKLIHNDVELTKTGIIIADIYNKIGNRKKGPKSANNRT